MLVQQYLQLASSQDLKHCAIVAMLLQMVHGCIVQAWLHHVHLHPFTAALWLEHSCCGAAVVLTVGVLQGVSAAQCCAAGA